MTHTGITNRYLRTLAAREIAGWRTVYARSQSDGGTMTRDELLGYARVITAAIGRVDLHLRRHGAALLSGDTEPLDEYPEHFFAGHG